jgi:class 3 adenylate cyclase
MATALPSNLSDDFTAALQEAGERQAATREILEAISQNRDDEQPTGDGITVIFNDPPPCDDPAGRALALALAMRERMAGLCTGWRRLGHRLGHGVGLSLGYATVGMVGSEGRYDYTASGTAVNPAARLCEEAAEGEILLSPRAFAAVEGRAAAEPAGPLTLKGFSAPVEVLRIAGDR